jgi:hypothetical protein
VAPKKIRDKRVHLTGKHKWREHERERRRGRGRGPKGKLRSERLELTFLLRELVKETRLANTHVCDM